MFGKWLLVGVCVTSSAYLAIQTHVAPPATKPKLIAPQTELDLGMVVSPAIVRASFTLHNAGSRRLIVREDVCSACGPAEWLIPPGQAQDLTIEMDTAGLRGEVRHVRHYTTSDPVQPRLALAVTVTVQTD